MLDNMTGGRVEVGFGRGIWPYEGPQFHPNADPRKDRENRELFQETVDIVRKIWTDEYFSHQGENYSFPVEDTVVLPSQVPIGPGLAGRGQGDEAAGDAQALPGAAPPAVDDRLHRPLRHDRRRAWAEGLLLAAPAPQDQAANGALRTGQERNGGQALCSRGGPGRHALRRTSPPRWRRRGETRKRGSCPPSSFNDPFRGRQVFTNPGEVLAPEVQLDWDFLEPRTLLVGSPGNVVERVQELQEVCNLDYLLVEFTHMGMPLSKTLRNLETFATKVMPRFAGDG